LMASSFHVASFISELNLARNCSSGLSLSMFS
jgi:hypothetical protein